MRAEGKHGGRFLFGVNLNAINFQLKPTAKRRTKLNLFFLRL